MSWPGAWHEYSTPQLSHEWMVRYLVLRKARRIGMIWTEGNGRYRLAPVGLDLERAASSIGVPELIRMITALESAPARKGPQSETGEGSAAECAA
ncbi:MAG TPA: hypothetical protein VHZ25_17915 [Acidobacteriaceae bacterium]|jgi:hypothetical protein|nr:hypothetical protein [Acidobacteriaceae bacterium]